MELIQRRKERKNSNIVREKLAGTAHPSWSKAWEVRSERFADMVE